MNTYSSKLYNILIEAGFSIEKVDRLWTIFSLTVDKKEPILWSASLGSLLKQAEIELGM